MKRQLPALLLLAAAIVGAATLCGCSDSDNPIKKPIAEHILGKWEEVETYTKIDGEWVKDTRGVCRERPLPVSARREVDKKYRRHQEKYGISDEQRVERKRVQPHNDSKRIRIYHTPADGRGMGVQL